MTQKRFVGAVAIAACATLLAACGDAGGSGEPGADGMTHVTLGFALAVPDASQSYYTSLPEKLGYWADEKLDVDIATFDGSNATITAVQANQADVTNTGTAGLAVAVEKGSDLIAYYPMATTNIYFPAAPEDSPIRSIKDFEGKKVGIQSLESTSYQYLRGILAGEGVNPDSVEYVPVGTGAEVAAALENGSIDTYQGSDTLYAQLKSAGVTMRRIPSAASDDIKFVTAMVASAADLDAHPDTYLGIARGIAKARAFAEANPEAAVRLHWEAYPDSKPRNVSEEEAMATAVQGLQGRLAAENLVDGVGADLTTDDIANTVKAYVAGGMIKSEVSPDKLFDDEFVGQINDFDAAAIQKQAKQRS
jgi:NitT/TauT family transport system substrate-binding protein